jgi:hypothetical protein
MGDSPPLALATHTRMAGGQGVSQLLYLLPISRLQLNFKSLASAHSSAIQPEMPSNKYHR